MLTDYFTDPGTLGRLRSGPGGPYLEPFIRHLETAGAAAKTIRNHLGAISHFSLWALREGVDLVQLDDAVRETFSEHWRTCRCFGRALGEKNRLAAWTVRFLDFARGLGAPVSLPARRRRKPAAPGLLTAFRQWAVQRGLKASTVKSYSWPVRQVVLRLGEAPSAYDAGALRRCVDSLSEGHKPKTVENIRLGVRHFLHYLSGQRVISAGLEGEVFAARGTPRRLDDGLVGPYLKDFLGDLSGRGLAPVTVAFYRGDITRYNAWVSRGALSLEQLDDASIQAFVDEIHPGPTSVKHVRHRIRRLLRSLHERGLPVPPGPPPAVRPRGTEPVLLRQFGQWMTQHRGLAPATLLCYGRPLGELLRELGEEPERYEPRGLRQFLLAYHARHGGRGAQHAVTALRVFLRYLAVVGRAKPGLDAAIPRVARWRLQSLPRYLKGEEVERVLGACDASTPRGLRDRVILLLLARLALRAGDVWRLQLSDIDARTGALRLCGKGRREARLPMPVDLAEALVAYLEHGRPRTRFGDLFLTLRPPLRPYPSSTFVTAIAAAAIRRAGLQAPSYGAHVLRHSAATEMLRQGASLEEIGAVLRHRFIDTTQVYAKVDLALLQSIAQPWPEVTPC